jgi:hypothetical protein
MHKRLRLFRVEMNLRDRILKTKNSIKNQRSLPERHTVLRP